VVVADLVVVVGGGGGARESGWWGRCLEIAFFMKFHLPRAFPLPAHV
jgi:hypothetical protein